MDYIVFVAVLNEILHSVPLDKGEGIERLRVNINACYIKTGTMITHTSTTATAKQIK